MQRIVLGLCTCFAIIVVGCKGSSTTSGEPAPSSKKVGGGGEPITSPIVGVWTLPEPKELPKEKGGGKIMITMEFTADGKVKHTENLNGKETTNEGTYKLEGNTVIITPAEGGRPERVTIETVTDNELTILDPKKGKGDIKFVRKK